MLAATSAPAAQRPTPRPSCVPKAAGWPTRTARPPRPPLALSSHLVVGAQCEGVRARRAAVGQPSAPRCAARASRATRLPPARPPARLLAAARTPQATAPTRAPQREEGVRASECAHLYDVQQRLPRHLGAQRAVVHPERPSAHAHSPARRHAPPSLSTPPPLRARPVWATRLGVTKGPGGASARSASGAGRGGSGTARAGAAPHDH